MLEQMQLWLHSKDDIGSTGDDNADDDDDDDDSNGRNDIK